MKNRIDMLIDRTRNAILTNDGSPDKQQTIKLQWGHAFSDVEMKGRKKNEKVS